MDFWISSLRFVALALAFWIAACILLLANVVRAFRFLYFEAKGLGFIAFRIHALIKAKTEAFFFSLGLALGLYALPIELPSRTIYVWLVCKHTRLLKFSYCCNPLFVMHEVF